MRFFLCLCLLMGCTGGQKRQEEFERWMEQKGKLKVLTTTAMIRDLVVPIGGEQVAVIALIATGLDPHSYQLVKGDNELLTASDLIFYNGLGLEHGPSLQNYLLREKKGISLGQSLWERFPNQIILHDEQIDPHIWTDVDLWSRLIPVIVNALSDKMPDYREQFTARGEALTQVLGQLHQELVEELEEVPAERRYLVTSHDAFNYFARAYLATDQEREEGSWYSRFAAPEGLAPDGQLSLTDIQMMISYLKQHGVDVVFPESNVSRDSLRKLVSVAEELGLSVRIANVTLYGDSLGEEGSKGESYEKMMRHNVRAIKEKL